MKTVSLNLRLSLPERIRLFKSGLRRHGYTVLVGLHPADLLCTWNRIGMADIVAKQTSAVIVAENAAWGNEFAGESWLSIARDAHNTAGKFRVGDSARWDSLRVGLGEWRDAGETVILPQRGIGSWPTAMPRTWTQGAGERYQARIREHPGTRPCKPLEEDLRHAGRVVTWGSGAAVKALLWGIPVTSEMPNWIAEQDNTDAGRLAMFRALAWAQWRPSEIESGEAFEGLL